MGRGKIEEGMPQKGDSFPYSRRRKDGKPNVGIQNGFRPHAMYDIRSMLELNMLHPEIAKIISEKYGYTEQYALQMIKEERRNFEDYYESMKENLVQTNIKRLNSMIYRLTAKGDNKSDKLSLQAIDILNKMIQAYEQKIKVETDKPIFEIKIDNE